MRRASAYLSTPVAALMWAGLGFGCQGTIGEPDGSAGGSESGGGSGVSGSTNAARGGSSSGASSAQGGSAANAGAAGSSSGGSVQSTGGAAGTPSLSQVATQYFPGQAAVDPRKRVFRLTRAQLDATTKSLLPKQFSASAQATLPRDPLQTNYEYADNLSFNPANFTPYTTWVSGMVDAVKSAPKTVIDCSASNDSPACLTEQAKLFVSRAFRGTASAAQLTRFADFFTSSVATVGLPSATADLVDLVLTSPSYVFRDEVLTDSAGALLPAQRLQQLTYTLADAPPDALGLSSATPNTYLQTPELAQKAVDRVLATPEARAKLLRFFLAWLEVKEADEFTIATSVFPEFTPDVAAAVVGETRAFLERQLGKATPKMPDLTETTESMVSGAEAFLYGKKAAATPSWVQLDATQRLGIFTQPAVLASHSGPTTSRLVKRGVFFVRKVMCMPLGSPPPDVDTTVPTSAGASERERVETVTAQPKCAGCHAFINPFGFMLENFDAIGRFRTSDEGTPINESVSVNFLDEGPVSVRGPVEALRTFTRSYRFQQCFARQLFRFYLGRDEVAGDDPILRQMFLDFANNGEQDLVRLLRTLAGSTTFSRRSETP